MWSNDLLSIIFTKVKVQATAKLKDRYPNIYFTTSTRVQTNPKFPTVLMQELSGPEERDLEGTQTNGVTMSIQVDVTDNATQNTANIVADVVYDIMKSMRFETVGKPIADDSDASVYRNIARYRRPIGGNDRL